MLVLAAVLAASQPAPERTICAVPGADAPSNSCLTSGGSSGIANAPRNCSALRNRRFSRKAQLSAVTTTSTPSPGRERIEVRDLTARRYFPAPRIKILMPGAKNGRQALRSLTWRFAPASPLWTRCCRFPNAKIDSPLTRKEREFCGIGRPTPRILSDGSIVAHPAGGASTFDEPSDCTKPPPHQPQPPAPQPLCPTPHPTASFPSWTSFLALGCAQKSSVACSIAVGDHGHSVKTF